MIDWLERGNAYLLERLKSRVAGPVNLIAEAGYPRDRIDVSVVQ